MNIKRSCGVLLPVFSLPSEHGIGTFGKAAYDFIDFLAAAGQSWWQMLPVGPSGSGDSPYQSFSSFAGNEYFIDLDMLTADGLLTKSEVESVSWGEDSGRVDYEIMSSERGRLLKLAAERGMGRDGQKLDGFIAENASWLPDYALYMALKEHFGMAAWTEWDEPIRMRTPEAVAKYTALLAADIRRFEYVQYLFYTQFAALRAYAHEKGIGLIGDMPIYVALDSADVWAQPSFFKLDEKNMPAAVAGVPPDYFSADGQLWGNPLYDWDAQRADGYGWWIRRIDGAAKLYDVLRIDHFRAFESYWSVPADAKTAKEGRWLKGPGMDLVGRLTAWFHNVQFIAEDLGTLTPEVHALLVESALPGMMVLEFAFDPNTLSDYLPHNFAENCVCYTGTHDNTPLCAWLDAAGEEELKFVSEYLGTTKLDDGVLRCGMRSRAGLFIAQMQDYLGLGADSRINTPGTPSGNWRWRLPAHALTPELAEKMRRMAYIYGRCGTDK